MIVPTLTYNCSLQGPLSEQRRCKLNSLVRRAKSIIQDGNTTKNIVLPSLENETKRRNCIFVRKCLDGNICDEFVNYFNPIVHEIETRNKSFLLRLPQMRTEYGKRSVFYNGAKVYNELPTNIRKEKDFKIFKEKVSSFYK